jgi:hypothetical protein
MGKYETLGKKLKRIFIKVLTKFQKHHFRKENKSKRGSRNPRRDLRRDFGGVRKFRF